MIIPALSYIHGAYLRMLDVVGISPSFEVVIVAVRSLIDQHQPHVVICGHIHEARRVDRIGAPEIINCGPAASGFYGVISNR